MVPASRRKEKICFLRLRYFSCKRETDVINCNLTPLKLASDGIENALKAA